MSRYLIKRILTSILVIIGVSILIFSISRVIPGDPARLALGPRATDVAVDNLRKEMNLDESLPKQYILWFKDVLKGDLGRSLTSKRPVSMDVKQFLPATLELMFFAAMFMVIFAFLLGMLSAKFKDSFVDGLIRILTYIGIALPAFVVATLLLLMFGFVIEGVIPVLGRISPGLEAPRHITGFYVLDGILSGNFKIAWDAFLHILLPALALSIGGMVQNARLLRASLIDNMNREYITVSKSFGLPSSLVMRKYLLKPSSVSVITVMGMDIASLFGNAFLVENIFNWPGLSRYGINSMLSKDLNSIVAVVLIIGVIFLVINLLVDLIAAAIDPRIRIGGD